MNPKVSRKKEMTNIRAQIKEIETKKKKKKTKRLLKLRGGYLKGQTKFTCVQLDLPKKDLNTIRNERRVAVSDTTEIQRNIRDCYEQLYANKLDNLEETGKSLETYNLPRLSHYYIDSLNRMINSQQTQSIIKSLPETKVQDQNPSMVNSTKHFQRRINNANPSQSLSKSMRIELFQTCFINSASP